MKGEGKWLPRCLGHKGVGRELEVGAGGIGQSAIKAAKAVGLEPVIAVDVAKTKLDLAKVSGATHVIDTASGSIAEHIKATTGGPR
jgi:aryl-alcohol dehydrogenase